jgi:deaminated glutathione amidase
MTAGSFIVGCVQVNPGDDRHANIERAAEGVRTAVGRGASLVLLPEYVTFLHASGNAMRSHALREEEDPALPRFRQLAREQGIWILIGSLALATDEGKLANRSFLISAQGDVAARYDKIHMFDATLPGGRVIRESSTYLPGTRAVVAATPWARLGLSICYDIRFPSLYRALSHAGAEVLVAPSAFTKATGTLHWKALLLARAIENGAYVVAPATCGSHPGGHQTYGHATIIDPNGQVLAEAGDEPDVICATIDIAAVAAARARIPSLSHDRTFQVEQAAPIPEEQHEPV